MAMLRWARATLGTDTTTTLKLYRRSFTECGYFSRIGRGWRFHGDGRLDLAIPNTGSSSVSILLGNGDGTFTAATGSPITVGQSPYAVTTGDFNADGRLDLAVANYTSKSISILLGNVMGTFTAVVGSPISVEMSPYRVTTGDFNGDGRLDLAASNFEDNSVSILFRGRRRNVYRYRLADSSRSRSYSIAVGDLNGMAGWILRIRIIEGTL